MTIRGVTHISIYVTDQDEALAWYQDKLGFEVCMDNEMVPGVRWLTICPADNQATQLVLMLANSDEEKTRVGSNLMTVLGTNDCIRDMAKLAQKKVEIVSPTEELPWGMSGVIRDLYGNPYNLVGPA